MVAAELALGIVFVAVCVSIPPCLLFFSQSIENLFLLKNKFRSADVDSDATEEPDPLEEDDETPAQTQKRPDPSKGPSEGAAGTPVLARKRTGGGGVSVTAEHPPQEGAPQTDTTPAQPASLEEELKPKNA